MKFFYFFICTFYSDGKLYFEYKKAQLDNYLIRQLNISSTELDRMCIDYDIGLLQPHTKTVVDSNFAIHSILITITLSIECHILSAPLIHTINYR